MICKHNNISPCPECDAARESVLDALREENDRLRGALRGCVDIVDKAGLLNLSNVFRLGHTRFWYVKASDTFDRARAALAAPSTPRPEQEKQQGAIERAKRVFETTSQGAYIRTMRDAANMTLRELSKRLDVSTPYLSDVEHGRRNLPKARWPALKEALPALNFYEMTVRTPPCSRCGCTCAGNPPLEKQQSENQAKDVFGLGVCLYCHRPRTPYAGAFRYYCAFSDSEACAAAAKQPSPSPHPEMCPHGCGAVPPTSGPHHLDDCKAFAASDDEMDFLEEQLCMAQYRLKELGHAEVVDEGESCCDACDRAIKQEKLDHSRSTDNKITTRKLNNEPKQ